MTYTNPDTFVTWTRTEDPGEFPKWESQCGVIEQIKFAAPLYRAFIGKAATALPEMLTNLSSMKKIVEREFLKENTLDWSYDD